MKRFRFQLQTALEWRKQRVAIEQARLDELQSMHQQLIQADETVNQNWKDSQESVLQSPTIMAAELAALDGYRRAVDQQKQRIQRELKKARELIDKQQPVLAEVMRNYRLLEKLAQRRLEDWRKASGREIEAEAAELYLARLNRENEERENED